MITANDNRRFGEEILPYVIEWLAHNVEPAEVFGDDALGDWATENDYIHVDEVEPCNCNESDLEEWAADNGWTKED